MNMKESSVVDQKTLNLDPDTEFWWPNLDPDTVFWWPNLDPDPGLLSILKKIFNKTFCEKPFF